MKNKLRGIIKGIFRLFLNFLYYGSLPFIIIIVWAIPKKHQVLIWGPVPIINNKYWSNSLKTFGYQSMTLMSGYYSIFKKDDFDLYFEDLVPRWIFPKRIREVFKPLFALLFIIRNASVIHIPFSGGPLGQTWIWKIEAFFYKMAGIKIIVIPYGADAYLYSKVMDLSLRNGLLTSYPYSGKVEKKIQHHVDYWTFQADIILPGFLMDGIGRWDCNIPSQLMIDTKEWRPKTTYSNYDGYNGVVKIIHTPNHRGFKGTEFLIDAVNQLKQEGLQVELLLLEKVPNQKVRELMQEADILAEQFIFIGYAMSGIEGMASGLPVISNLENEEYTRVFRRYSFLNECPILSASPETLANRLRILVTNPKLRKELGQAGRKYVEKYHSYEMAQFLFGSIYNKILNGQDIDLMNLFHPLKAEYNKRTPLVEHPLVENKLPKEYLNADKIG